MPTVLSAVSIVIISKVVKYCCSVHEAVFDNNLKSLMRSVKSYIQLRDYKLTKELEMVFTIISYNIFQPTI